jgi:hypothetical protein
LGGREWRVTFACCSCKVPQNSFSSFCRSDWSSSVPIESMRAAAPESDAATDLPAVPVAVPPLWPFGRRR